MDKATLDAAMGGQDLVFANLSGNMEAQAKTIVSAMKAIGVMRGTYDLGVTYGPWTNAVLVGKALAPIRDKVTIATKFGWNIDQTSGTRGPGLKSRAPSRSARWPRTASSG